MNVKFLSAYTLSLLKIECVNQTTQYFHKHLPGSQISVCLPFQSFVYDGREYDALNLSLSADLLYIMDYDTQDQIYSSQCVAAANAPYFGMIYGIEVAP